ncbi:hypothetical protein Nepgr_001143 [Nepenthes gracilis]|uniref:Uncharacterized protein n=1 Tax=Nepenthes gracilis TaxID=150966 RepID=A0AAD3P7Q6_NEPGR|nr:hypothetical protein Nepgr_001143 [Nepenthes gracilis]
MKDSRQSCLPDDELRTMRKHQTPLPDYLGLQKEIVSKKRKLHEAKQRKAILLAEIRFLRQRRKFLLKGPSQRMNREQVFVLPQKQVAECKAHVKERYCGSNAKALENQNPTMETPLKSGHAEKSNSKEAVGMEPFGVVSKIKNLLKRGNKVDKRNVAWQDQLTLKVAWENWGQDIQEFIHQNGEDQNQMLLQ